jgi:DNA-binding GntR family transcriptional regulator
MKGRKVAAERTVPIARMGSRTGPHRTINVAARDISTHASDIVRQIEQEIAVGRWLPGAKLDERSLAEQFAVSRTPVREALQRLSAGGLVVLRGRQGAQIVELQTGDLLDSFFLVAELEGMAARLAARRMRPDERDIIRTAHDRCGVSAAAGDEEGFVRANAAFHDAIIAAAHSRVVGEQLARSKLLIAWHRYYATFRPGRMASSIVEHEGVMTAIFSGDSEKAAALMSQHVNMLGDNLSDVVNFLESLRAEATPSPRV